MKLRVLWTSWHEPLPREREERWLAALPVDMRNSCVRLRRWQDRQATLLGKMLLLKALQGDETAAGERGLLERLERLPAGKPYLPGGPGFNISHSGNRVVLALAEQGQVGIDVEQIRPIATEEFSRYLPALTPDEPATGAESLRRFYSCWTRMEAVLKGDGCGLSVSPEQVQLREDRALLKQQVWHLTEIACGTEYCCHVATAVPVSSCSIEPHPVGADHAEITIRCSATTFP